MKRRQTTLRRSRPRRDLLNNSILGGVLLDYSRDRDSYSCPLIWYTSVAAEPEDDWEDWIEGAPRFEDNPRHLIPACQVPFTASL